MPVALRLTVLVTALFASHAMAADGTITFLGAVVEPTCQIKLSPPGAVTSHIHLRHCNQTPAAQLTEQGDSRPSLRYRLTDAQGHALSTLSADTEGLLQAVAQHDDGVTKRNLILVLEYL